MSVLLRYRVALMVSRHSMRSIGDIPAVEAEKRCYDMLDSRLWSHNLN
jgi:hypothetical protein